MIKQLKHFERISRGQKTFGLLKEDDEGLSHPFDERNIHSEVASVSLKLFDDGHFSQATFEAYKLLDNQVKSISGSTDSGFKLMMAAFSETNPKIKLTNLVSQSDLDEQLGYKFVFAGVMSAIRNPRGHEIKNDPINRCLDHLSLASVLLRRLDERMRSEA